MLHFDSGFGGVILSGRLSMVDFKTNPLPFDSLPALPTPSITSVAVINCPPLVFSVRISDAIVRIAISGSGGGAMLF